MKQYILLEDAKSMTDTIMDRIWKKFLENRTELAGRLGVYLLLFKEKPAVEWKKRGFSTAGMAYFNKRFPQKDYYISMNSNFLYSPDANTFIEKTLIHEFAHIAGNFVFDFNHGEKWKYINLFLGGNGKRCHEYRPPENKPDQYFAICSKCGQIIEINKTTAKNIEDYQHVSCNGFLKMHSEKHLSKTAECI